MADLPVGIALPGPRKGELRIDLRDHVVMVLVANHAKTPRTKSGEVDWARVSRVKILKIGKQDG